MQPADKVEKRWRRAAVWLAENILPAVQRHHALVDVHGAAGLALHGLGHESGVHIVADGHLAHGALEQEHLVGQRQRVAVVQVDFHLRGTHFMNQRVQRQPLCLAPVVHHVEDVVVFVDGVDAEALHAGLGTPRAANWWLQRHVFVRLHLYQVKLHLGRHDRAPAFLLVQFQDALEHVARRERGGRAVEIDAVVDDLRGGLLGPRYRPQRAGVGDQPHVRVGRGGEVLLGVVAGDGHHQHGLGQAQALGRVVFVARHDLAARQAGHVRYQALHFGNVVFVQPALDGLRIVHGQALGLHSRVVAGI